MATEDQIAALRLMVNEPDDSRGWTDERLAAAIDEADTLNQAAAAVWNLKAGEYAELVDVSESGSSRKLGDLRKAALEMGAHYTGQDAPPVTQSAPIIRRIRRGFS